MAYTRFSARRSSRFSSRGRYGRRVGTRFVGRRYSNRVPGREVPYYLSSGVEAHVLDNSITATITGQAGPETIADTYPLNLITRGTGIYDRESIRADMKYVLLRLRLALWGITFPNVGSWLITQPVTMRVMLVYTTRAVATAPGVLDFLTSPGNNNALIATAGVQRIDSRENYQILYDNKMVVRNTNGSFTSQANQPLYPEGDFTFKDLDLRIPINRSVSFTANSTTPVTLSDLTSGALFLYFLYDGSWNAANNRIGMQVAGSSRLIFAP